MPSKKSAPKTGPAATAKKKAAPKKSDPVNHPSHYTQGKIEVIDYIEDKDFGYRLGSVIKYVSRAGKKDPSKRIEDLKKAAWYLNREIQKTQQLKEKKGGKK